MPNEIIPFTIRQDQVYMQTAHINGSLAKIPNKYKSLNRPTVKQQIPANLKGDTWHFTKSDEYGRLTSGHVKKQDGNGKTIVDKFTSYEYSDNGNIKSKSVEDRITCETTTLKYDEDGNITEKFVKKGAVTTYYDAEDKPVRRETDKGSGIIVTEDLTE